MSDEKPSTISFFERTFRSGTQGLADLATGGKRRGRTVTVLLSQVESVSEVAGSHLQLRTKTGQNHKAWAENGEDLEVLRATIIRGMQ